MSATLVAKDVAAGGDSAACGTGREDTKLSGPGRRSTNPVDISGRRICHFCLGRIVRIEDQESLGREGFGQFLFRSTNLFQTLKRLQVAGGDAGDDTGVWQGLPAEFSDLTTMPGCQLHRSELRGLRQLY